MTARYDFACTYAFQHEKGTRTTFKIDAIH